MKYFNLISLEITPPKEFKIGRIEIMLNSNLKYIKNNEWPDSEIIILKNTITQKPNRDDKNIINLQ